MHEIVVVGFGWVGQANALSLSFLGYKVSYFDVGNPAHHYEKDWKKQYEEIEKLADPLDKDSESTVYFVCVGDRVSADGKQDVSSIRAALHPLSTAKGVTVLRSTILPQHIHNLKFDFYLPEFLHEMHAVEECLHPHFFVLGRRTERTEPEVFSRLEKKAAYVFRGTPEECSYVKYLSNIWNSCRIAFTNHMGDILSRGGADIPRANRILDFVFGTGPYLKYGKAYGGHCLPKDTLSFWRAHDIDGTAALIRAIHDSNERHKNISFYRNLPEWFSRWEYSRAAYKRSFRNVWNKLNSLKPVRVLRQALRPITKIVSIFAPDRDLEGRRRLWNLLARENPLYYSHPGNPSGKKIREYEFRESGKWEYERYIENDSALTGLLRDKTKALVLDFGSGAGRHAEFFARNFGEYVGVDFSEEMLKAAAERLSGFDNVRFIPSDGRNIPLQNDCAHLIFSRQTLESAPSLSDLRECVREMYRVLKRGGVLKVEIRAVVNPYRWRHSHGVYIPPHESREFIESAGYRVMSSEFDGKHVWITAVK